MPQGDILPDLSLQNDGRGEEDVDIYRGSGDHPPPLHNFPTPSIYPPSIASSDSSGFSFGDLGHIVETAISKWARRRRRSSSASSSSSSSSESSVASRKKRRRRLSTATIRTVQSEQDIVDRIKAREDARHITREFTLYLPPGTTTRDPGAKDDGVTTSPSLPLVLGKLETVMRRYARARRQAQAAASVPIHTPPIAESPPAISPEQHLDYMIPASLRAPSRPASFTDLRRPRKGKQKEGSRPPTASTPKPLAEDSATSKMPKAWWLDVASPTWEDMRAIGNLLHLHPLTLEDILQQDPREKLELFPGLGYYLVTFRAIESQTTRERFQRYTSADSAGAGFDGVIGEALVYLVVFKEGIISFHFTDISEHIDRVRNRILLLEEIMSMSSDWIAHGLLDSVVDSFFPFLEEIEHEVVQLENIIFSGSTEPPPPPMSPAIVIGKHNHAFSEKDDWDVTEVGSFDEKSLGTTLRVVHAPRFAIFGTTISILYRRSKWIIRHTSKQLWKTKTGPSQPWFATTLKRIAKTRRLVTSLTRLLATKSEVVQQIRKRLLTTNTKAGLGNGTDKIDDIEVAVYMGDVQDHILTLQHSLAHYERMLSQSHPTYLAQLRNNVSKTKSGSDKAILVLTIVSIGVLCAQTVIGAFSMNVHVPQNGKAAGYPFNVFGVVISLVAVALATYLSAVRRWWKKAKRRSDSL